MTRRECLEMAMGCVLQDRASQYGGVEDNFRTIANFWSVYLGRKVYPADVAAMMALLKIARAKANPKHGDNWVDLAGYAACGAECANIELYPWQKEVMGTATPEPEFKPGDSLLVTMPDGENVPCVYVGETERPGCCCVRYLSGDNSGDTDDTVPIDQLRRVPVSKAEGCEALVEQDAPQTPEEVCRRIVDSNPATYGHPHKPTGEELAEMAREEDADGGA